PDRSASGAERMIQTDDGSRLGEPVALNDDEPELAPELFEPGVERGGAHHERPEFQSEEPVHAPIPPPAPDEMLFLSAWTDVWPRGTHHVLARHIEDLRDRHQHRDAPAL